MPHPIDVTEALFAEFGAANIPGILEWLHPQIQIDFFGPEVIPYAGTYRGLAEAQQFFERVLASVDIHVFDAQEMFCDGPNVSVTGVLHLTAKSTGRDIHSNFAHVIRVEDDKWIRFRDYMDTSQAVAAFS